MRVIPVEPKGLVLIEPILRRDDRGFFLERFQAERFWSFGLPTDFVQDNHSRSMAGVLRGLHYQRSPAQGKLVGVTRGRIWDIAVDLRADSPTFGKSFGIELSDEDGRQLWIPPGFAHGFCVLGSVPADVVYKVDAPYRAEGESGIHWADPELAIAWPVERPILSERDASLPSFALYRLRPVAWDDERMAGKGKARGIKREPLRKPLRKD